MNEFKTDLKALVPVAEFSQPGRWKMPAGMRSLVGGSALPQS